MLKKLNFFLICLSLLAVGCATPYQSLKHEGNFPYGGYSSRQIGEQEFEINFTGNRFTSPERIREYWHRRAVEICYPGGYEVMSLNFLTDEKGRDLPVIRGEVLCK